MDVNRALNQYPIFVGEYLPTYIHRLQRLMYHHDLNKLMSFNDTYDTGLTSLLLPRVSICFAYRQGSTELGGRILADHNSARFWRSFVTEEHYKRQVYKAQNSPKSTSRVLAGDHMLGFLISHKQCRQCMLEDEARFGVAIKRSIHQVPTIFTCPIHQTPLDASIPFWRVSSQDPINTDDILSKFELILSKVSLLNDLQRVTLLLLSNPTSESRAWLQSVKSEMLSALKGKDSNGRCLIPKKIQKDWEVFFAACLFKITGDVKFIQEIPHNEVFKCSRLLSPRTTNVHPVVIIMLMVFTEQYGNFSVKW